MKPISIGSALLLLCMGWESAHAQQQELRWGEFGCYSNWDRSPYAIQSEYKFLGRLPDLREFPLLLEAALDPKMDGNDREVIFSQMRTLSRCDFQKRFLEAGDNAEEEHRAAVVKWKDWWDRHGMKTATSPDGTGQGVEKAWAQVAPTPYLECPKYPVPLPSCWSSTISFRSGDYGGVTEEVIDFRVDNDRSELRRRYRTGGAGEWTHEIWQNFSREEANHFLASLVYLIDNPWFLASDELSEAQDGEEKPSRIGQIRGRPAAWTDYYPGYKWTGILDENRNVIINHDPWSWDTIDYKLGPETSLDSAFGIVFRLVRDLFPDPSWDPDSSKWKKTDPDPGQKGNPE